MISFILTSLLARHLVVEITPEFCLILLIESSTKEGEKESDLVIV
jgi:hypothetical protein